MSSFLSFLLFCFLNASSANFLRSSSVAVSPPNLYTPPALGIATNVGCDVAARCRPAHCFAASVSALNAQTRTFGADRPSRSASCFHVG